MPCGTQRHSAAKVAPGCKYVWTLRRLSCGMLFDAARPKNLIGKLSVPSKEVAWHRGFKMVSASWKKKLDKVHRSCSTVFVTWRSAKIFFHVGAIALAAYTQQLLMRSKEADCCILPHGIVRTHLKAELHIRQFFENRRIPNIHQHSLAFSYKLMSNLENWLSHTVFADILANICLLSKSESAENVFGA